MFRRIFYKFPRLVGYYHYLLARLAALWHGHPSRRIFVIGVTGTKGKTTALELLNSILEAAGKRTALLSSFRIKIGERSERSTLGNTMPGRFFIQRFLSKAVRAGCDYALIEVTSQGVAMHRHRFIDWNMAVLTNLAPEHIEAHGSFEKYRLTKLDFLEYVVKLGGRVFINKDDKNFRYFGEALQDRDVIEYSKSDAGIETVLNPNPMEAVPQSEEQFFLSDFNKDNIAAAAAVALDLGVNGDVIKEAVRNFPGVPGRMEFVRQGGATVVIDYAHTPDSLELVYKTLLGLKSKNPASQAGGQDLKPGRLICVLGAAGGGRDKWKRPAMGKIASEYCDEIILTNEDPYDEDPKEIILEIKKGVAPEKIQSTDIVLSRREAIGRAVDLAKEGDIVAVTGKGSEPWLHISRGRKVPWSDRRVVEDALKKRGGR